MQTSIPFVIGASFLACTVEMVEALTIVLAAGVTRGWRSALIGTGVAVVVLAGVTAVVGPAITLLPIRILQLVVGGLLLAFGLQWLRKAILRASGLKAVHDEDAIFEEERQAALTQGSDIRVGLDWYGFTLCFKGVLLEGLEVVFIVLTLGGASQIVVNHTSVGIPLAAAGAAGALVLVTGVGVAIHRPLSRVPENTLKFCVGLMLTTFGTFWSAEGAGVAWPGGDAAILGALAFYVVVSLTLVQVLKASAMPANQAMG